MGTAPAEQSSSDAKPNFVFGGNRIIREDNWGEFQAHGFFPLERNQNIIKDEALREKLQVTARLYGSRNVFIGDTFDKEADRPLHHKPGLGLYSNPEGREHATQVLDELHEMEDRLRRDQSSTGPDSS